MLFNGIDLPATLVFDFPTVGCIIKILSDESIRQNHKAVKKVLKKREKERFRQNIGKHRGKLLI